jgi:hypothetical protein
MRQVDKNRMLQENDAPAPDIAFAVSRRRKTGI